MLTPKIIECLLNWRVTAETAPKTVIVDPETLNTAFHRAEPHGVILKNPGTAIRPPNAESSERDVFSNDGVERLTNAAPTLDWQTLILLGYFVGARLRDCVQMKWENVHPEKGVIIYHQQKTGNKAIVPMHYHVIEHLKQLSKFGTDGFLCPKLANKVPGGEHGLSEGFKRIVSKAGIDPMTVEGKGTRKFTRLTFHCKRHAEDHCLWAAGTV